MNITEVQGLEQVCRLWSSGKTTWKRVDVSWNLKLGNSDGQKS